MADFDPAVAARWNQRLAQDPEYQRLVAAANQPVDASNAAGHMDRLMAVAQYLKAKGIPKGYQIGDIEGGGPLGTIGKGQDEWWENPYTQAAIIGGLGFGGMAAGALGGSAPTTAAGGWAGDFGPTMAQLTGTEAAKVASTVGASSALGAGGKLIPTLISAGTKLGGALLGSHAAGKAAKQQEAAMQQALDLNRGLFERSQANFDPYVNMGPQSMARLGQFLGIQPQPPASVPMSSLVGRR